MELDSFQAIITDDQGKTHFHKDLLSLIKKKSQKLIPILAASNIWNSCDSCGNTLLHIAAQYKHWGLITYLLRSGSQIDVQNNEGKTPLIIAIEKRSQEFTEILLEANADVFISDNSGKNALNWFLSIRCRRRSDWARLILNKVESQCLGNNEMITNKLLAAGWPVCCAGLLENLEVTEMMLKRGCQVDARESEQGHTALHVAVMSMGVRHVKFLLDNKADPNVEDNWHRTPICYVSRNEKLANDRVEVVKLLIDRGAVFVTTDGTSNYSQVKWLLSHGNRQVIAILLQANLAQLLNKQEENNFPLHDLVSNKNPDVIEDVFKALAGHTIDVNSRDSTGQTALSVAAFHGNLVAVELLLARGADVNTVTHTGYSTLYRCVDHYLSFRAKHKECIQLFLEHGADVSHTMSLQGHSPTVFDMVQANLGYKPVAELLLAHVALQKALGVHVADFIIKKIHSHPPFDDYYNFCMRHLLTELYNSVTLLDLLKVEFCEFVRYMREEELASSIERFNDEWKTKLDYFNTILQKRYAKVKLLKLQREAANQLCEIMKTDYYRHPMIADQTISYLDEKDLRNLLLVPL